MDTTGKNKRGKYKTKDSRLKYKHLHVDPATGRYVCNICDKSLKTLQCFRRHVCLPGSKGGEMTRGNDRRYCCHQCGKMLASLSGFKLHQAKHDLKVSSDTIRSCDNTICACGDTIQACGYNTHACGKEVFNCLKLIKHKKPQVIKKECLMCGFSNTSLQYMKSHVRCHLGTRPCVCQRCNKGFEWESYLRDHLKNVHLNIRLYSCEACGKQFKRKSSLVDHVKAEHTGEKPHACTQCSKSFVRATSLRNHLRSHLLDKKPKMEYKCQLCNNRSFIDKTCLAAHIASAHSDEKPYVCDVCGKRFKLKNWLKAHCQTHSDERPYDCELCDSAFKLKKDLWKHQERHKSSKDYCCTICGKAFVTKNDVYLHQRVHDPSKYHRIYKPGKYKVCNGELLSARTRKNMLALKEQEPISFDTEINGNSGVRLDKSSIEKGAIFISATKNCTYLDSNEQLPNQPVNLDMYLYSSNDSEKLQNFKEVENGIATKSSLDMYLCDSDDNSVDNEFNEGKPSQEGWNSAQILEDYSWLDSSSPQDETVANDPSSPFADSRKPV